MERTIISSLNCIRVKGEGWIPIQPGPEDIKRFSCPTQLSVKFVLLINLKLLRIASSFLLNIAEHENSSSNECENVTYCWHFRIY